MLGSAANSDRYATNKNNNFDVTLFAYGTFMYIHSQAKVRFDQNFIKVKTPLCNRRQIRNCLSLDNQFEFTETASKISSRKTKTSLLVIDMGLKAFFPLLKRKTFLTKALLSTSTHMSMSANFL